KPLLARIDGEEDELEVIGSGISGSFDPTKAKRLPMRLPNLNYSYPEANVQNFSPGTSLIFNAYRGHSGLLTHPYMTSNEGANRSIQDNAYRRTQSSLSQEVHPEQSPLQQVAYPHREPSGQSSYHQPHPMENPTYRASYDRQYHPYQSNDPRDSRDYQDHRDYGDPREYDDPMNYPSHRSPRMSSSAAVHRTSIASPSRAEQTYDNQSRISEHSDHHRLHEDYPSNSSSFPQHSSPHPPPQHIPSDSGRYMQPPSHSTPPKTQHWRRPDNDRPNVHHSYDGKSRYQAPQPQLSTQHRVSETWDNTSDLKPPIPTAAIDIPRPRNRGSTSYANNVNRHEPIDSNMRSQHHQSHPNQSQYGLPGSMGSSGVRGPFNQRPTGPRYSLSRVNYRMIFEYASEIRECLIKGKPGTTDRLLYNAEILSKVFLGCRSDIDPNAPVEEEATLNPHQTHCTSCNISKTPEWRRGPLVWGKLSRSKAALVTKSKQESPSAATASTPTITSTTTAGDINMTDATAEGRRENGAEVSQTSAYSVPTDGLRKRGREVCAESDDEEALARDEDIQAIEATRLEMEASHLIGPDQLMGNMTSLPVEGDDTTPNEQTRNQIEQDSHIRPPSDSTMTLSTPPALDENENQGGVTPAAGDKLALSFLLTPS
ncbi:hypothetical protein BGX27_001306, partial [Mortierella sp. AM989]